MGPGLGVRGWEGEGGERRDGKEEGISERGEGRERKERGIDRNEKFLFQALSRGLCYTLLSLAVSVVNVHFLLLSLLCIQCNLVQL